MVGRVRSIAAADPRVTEMRMFGGVGFLVNGNLACAASKRGLLVRVDPDESGGLILQSGAELMVMRGRRMAGWISVNHDALLTEAPLGSWVGRGIAFTGGLAPK